MNRFLQRLEWIKEASENMQKGLQAKVILEQKTGDATAQTQLGELQTVLDETIAYVRAKVAEIDIEKTRSEAKKKIIRTMQESSAAEPTNSSMKQLYDAADNLA